MKIKLPASKPDKKKKKKFKEFSSLKRLVDGIITLRRIKDTSLEAKKLCMVLGDISKAKNESKSFRVFLPSGTT